MTIQPCKVSLYNNSRDDCPRGDTVSVLGGSLGGWLSDHSDERVMQVGAERVSESAAKSSATDRRYSRSQRRLQLSSA